MEATPDEERQSFDHARHGVALNENTSPIPPHFLSESLGDVKRRRISASERRLFASYESFNYDPTENQLLDIE
jgi:hypothetical protein